jgi:hypothetical protein
VEIFLRLVLVMVPAHPDRPFRPILITHSVSS